MEQVVGYVYLAIVVLILLFLGFFRWANPTGMPVGISWFLLIIMVISSFMANHSLDLIGGITGQRAAEPLLAYFAAAGAIIGSYAFAQCIKAIGQFQSQLKQLEKDG